MRDAMRGVWGWGCGGGDRRPTVDPGLSHPFKVPGHRPWVGVGVEPGFRAVTIPLCRVGCAQNCVSAPRNRLLWHQHISRIKTANVSDKAPC